MVDRPILFSAPMVLALLEGRKTQTRRLVKDPRGNFDMDQFQFSHLYDQPAGVLQASFQAKDRRDDGVDTVSFRVPAGQPGDRLWVKETHRFDVTYDSEKPTDLDPRVAVFYEADGSWRGMGVKGKTRVSLHMQQRFSRLTLDLKGVRVERLNDCSESDALAEGVTWSDQWQGFVVPGVEHPGRDFPVLSRATAREMYAALWDTIHGSGAWLANPWVWVYDIPRAAA